MPQQKRDQVQEEGNFLVGHNYPQHCAKHPNAKTDQCRDFLSCRIRPDFTSEVNQEAAVFHAPYLCLTCCQTGVQTSLKSQRLTFLTCVWSILPYAVCVTPIQNILFSLWICTGNKSTWFTELLCMYVTTHWFALQGNWIYF